MADLTIKVRHQLPLDLVRERLRGLIPDLRRALHAYVVLALPKTAAYDFARDAADRTFAPRDCVALVHQLKR